MKLTAQVKLLPTPEQVQLLKQTLITANAACNYISEQGWKHKILKQYPLHRLTYYNTRDKFPLSAQIVVRCIAKVANAYKAGKKRMRVFKPFGAVTFDSRVLTYNTKEKWVSIWTIEGRQHIPFACGERQIELLNGRRGESNLCFVKGKFYLLVACDVETPEQQDIQDVLGVDLGITNLAVTSDGEHFSGKDVDKNRRKYVHRHQNLQKKQTKSAKRKLKKISGKQKRFQSHTNHTISKRIVQKAQDTRQAIALEDLSGIREAPVRRSQRNKHANWSFYQLRNYITYKARRIGIPVILVNPKYTSQTCSVCGHISKSNRTNQSNFSCVSCGHSANADTNAAVVIAARAVVNLPMVSPNDDKGLSSITSSLEGRDNTLSSGVVYGALVQ